MKGNPAALVTIAVSFLKKRILIHFFILNIILLNV